MLGTGLFGQHRPTVPFAFLYEYRPVEDQALLVSVSAETDDDLHPTVVDCDSESIWRFHAALSEDTNSLFCARAARRSPQSKMLNRILGPTIPGPHRLRRVELAPMPGKLGSAEFMELLKLFAVWADLRQGLREHETDSA